MIQACEVDTCREHALSSNLLYYVKENYLRKLDLTTSRGTAVMQIRASRSPEYSCT